MSKKIPSRDTTPQLVKMYTPAAGSADLYEKRHKIQPRYTSGLFEIWRNIGAWTMLGLYFLTAWLTWDGRQALLFDLPNRHFYIFGWTFWPQDFILLSWLLIIAAFGLFAVTVLAGRVWCGYTCPQTVWTKIFLLIERLCEGDRNTRMRLDKAPLSFNKIVRRGFKHLGWLLVSIATGVAFVGYFTPVHILMQEIAHHALGPAETFWIGFFTVATYMNAGWLREQICMYMCPYGRFQSVMFDRDTLIISYDHARGEPRGSRRRDADHAAQHLGDCIDCELCVQVCPTGIDIRDGLQFQCIACAACIDACDSVMDQMGYDRGLVRYSTENALEHGKPINILRPRLLGYAAVMAVMVSLFVYSLSTRIPMGIDVIRDRNALYRESSEGLIENSYVLNIMNKAQEPEHVAISLSGMPKGAQLEGRQQLLLAPGEMRSVTETVEDDPSELKEREIPIEFHLINQNHPDQHVDSTSRFFAPSTP
ncbi:MAG: cytochrome c oxidase accessory protein CcoG [Pseudomonadales bacterium]|nr:cytochrome c oxidase accessory protein CcoG [Pseudomonadales bacterium]